MSVADITPKVLVLTAILRPMTDRDSVTFEGMEERKLPEPNGRLGSQWYSWFTQYVVEQNWSPRPKGSP